MAGNLHSRRQAGQISSISSLIRWLQLKNYQYEVTFSLYMLTYTEKIVFNSILFLLVSLFCTAAYYYLPGHIMIIYNRVWYYIHGEFALEHARLSLPYVSDISGTLRAAKEAVVSQSLEAMAASTVARAAHSAQSVRNEL